MTLRKQTGFKLSKQVTCILKFIFSLVLWEYFNHRILVAFWRKSCISNCHSNHTSISIRLSLHHVLNFLIIAEFLEQKICCITFRCAQYHCCAQCQCTSSYLIWSLSLFLYQKIDFCTLQHIKGVNFADNLTQPLSSSFAVK